MKKRQLIEWGIITISLVCGYKFFEHIVFIITRYFDGRDNQRYIENIVLPMLISTFIYLVFFILLLKNSRRLAALLIGSRNDETLQFKIGKRALLHVILVGICLSVIISNIGAILVYFLERFRNEMGDLDQYARTAAADKTYAFKMAVSKTILALAVIIFSRNICQWFVRSDDQNELVFDSDTQK